nr:hypothetical protein [Nostoc sp. EkiNYC01]
MNFGNIKLPPAKYDCKIFVYQSFRIEITFYREVDTLIISDILSLQKDGIEVNDYRKNHGYFAIDKNPYDNKELAESIALHLKEKHNLKVFIECIVYPNSQRSPFIL